MARYSKECIISKVDGYSTKMRELFQQAFIDYLSKTTGPDPEFCSEVIAKHLLNNFDRLNKENFLEIERISSYKSSGHKGIDAKDIKTNRIEEWQAKCMFEKEYDLLGKVIDYQVPLQNDNKDKKVGAIDLISYKDGCLYLIELKRENSKETLLHPILEIYTYSKIVNEVKLLSDYKLPSDTKIVSTILVFKKSKQYEQYNKDSYHNVRELMNKLKVQMHLIKTTGEAEIPGSKEKLDLFKVTKVS